MVRRIRLAGVAAVVALVVLSACGDGDGEGQGAGTGPTPTTAAVTTSSVLAGEDEAVVRFAEPLDGATVASPVKVRMEATDFTIEPAGEVREGAGHFHIVVDAECVAVGEVVPSDPTHLHYGKAQTEAEVPLAPGRHTLCLQVGDGAHSALDLTETITIEVSAG